MLRTSTRLLAAALLALLLEGCPWPLAGAAAASPAQGIRCARNAGLGKREAVTPRAQRPGQASPPSAPGEDAYAKPTEVEADEEAFLVAYMEEGAPSQPWLAYANYPVWAYGEASDHGDAVAVFPGETPLSIFGEKEGFLQLAVPEGDRLYVPAEELQPLPVDQPTSYKAYVDGAAPVMEWPLSGSDVLGVWLAGQQLQVWAHNGRYARVQAGDQEGYVLRDQLSADPPAAVESGLVDLPLTPAALTLAYVPRATATYLRPHPQGASGQHVAAGTLLAVDGEAAGYTHVAALDVFVPTASLELLPVEALSRVQGYWDTSQLLYGDPSQQIPLGAMLPGRTLVDIPWQMGDYFCVQVEGQWAFVQAQGVKTLEVEALAEARPMVVRSGTPLKSSPMDGEENFTPLAMHDIPLWLSQMVNRHAQVTQDGESYYVEYGSLRYVEAVEPVAAYQAYVDKSTPLLDFPAVCGSQVGVQPGNALVRIQAQNDQYALVEHEGGRAYVARSALYPVEDGALDALLKQRYHILVQREQGQMSVYEVNEWGVAIGKPVLQASVVMGVDVAEAKAGILALGKKELWRAMGGGYARYAIGLEGKGSLHGPLYQAQEEDAPLLAPQEEGRGGISVSDQAMLWLYYHCGPENTTLEIVKR